jgi:cell division protein FtsQ
VSPATLVDLPRRRRWWPQRRWLRLVLSLLIVAVVAAVVYIVTATPVIGVRTVTVHGGDQTLRAEVEHALPIRTGTPMARVDVGSAAADISAAVPTLKTVTVTRKWPGTIDVRIVARVAVIGYKDVTTGGWRLVDEQGVVVSSASSLPPGITAVDAPKSPALVTSAAEVVAALPAAVRTSIASIRVPSRDSITLTTSKNQTIVWGSSDDTAQKARVLTVLLRQKARVYDVSAPDLPTTKA